MFKTWPIYSLIHLHQTACTFPWLAGYQQAVLSCIYGKPFRYLAAYRYDSSNKDLQCITPIKMTIKKNPAAFVLLFAAVFSLSSCLTSKKMDKFVAQHYNNELPKLAKKKKADIVVMSTVPSANSSISTTVHKTNSFLPLIVYWQYKHRQNCSLNSAIAVTNFTNTINATATKGLSQKLNSNKLELTVEEAPSGFSMVLNEHMVWLVYAFSWAKIYIEPDYKDLVVSYKMLQEDGSLKTGKIIVKNTDKAKGLRFFQSWKSATSEYLSDYTANLTTMTRSFVTQLTNEL